VSPGHPLIDPFWLQMVLYGVFCAAVNAFFLWRHTRDRD
jgi:hypothetical protein